MFITLDYRSRVPLCDQLCEAVIRMAACGAAEPGDMLPSVRSLAQELGINPNTVQKSYRTLEQQGIIDTVPGKGSFIARKELAQDRLRQSGREALRTGIETALNRGISPQEVTDIVSAYLREKEGKPND